MINILKENLKDNFFNYMDFGVPKKINLKNIFR